MKSILYKLVCYLLCLCQVVVGAEINVADRPGAEPDAVADFVVNNTTGAVISGTDNTAALQDAFTDAAAAGDSIFIPKGNYLTGPITITWPTTLPSIRGEGKGSALWFKDVPEWGGGLNLLGTGNVESVNCHLHSLHLLHTSTGTFKKSFLLRMGDAKQFFLAERLWLDGASGISIKNSTSASYAQIGTQFNQVMVHTNAGGWWGSPQGTETGFDGYALYPESSGQQADTLLFKSCSFNGLCYMRAWKCVFDTCDFCTHPTRPNTDNLYSGNVVTFGPNLTMRDCYHEDFSTAISVVDWNSVYNIDIQNPYFNSISNYVDATVGTTVDYAALSDSGIFTNYTTAANNATVNDVVLLPPTATATVGDAFYVGLDEVTFGKLSITISTSGVGTYDLVGQFWDGDSWDAIVTPTDSTGPDFKAAPAVVTYSYTRPATWATTTVNGQGPYYFMRFYLSSISGSITQPKATKIVLLDYNYRADQAMQWQLVGPGSGIGRVSVVGGQFANPSAFRLGAINGVGARSVDVSIYKNGSTPELGQPLIFNVSRQ